MIRLQQILLLAMNTFIGKKVIFELFHRKGVEERVKFYVVTKGKFFVLPLHSANTNS